MFIKPLPALLVVHDKTLTKCINHSIRFLKVFPQFGILCDLDTEQLNVDTQIDINLLSICLIPKNLPKYLNFFKERTAEWGLWKQELRKKIEMQ